MRTIPATEIVALATQPLRKGATVDLGGIDVFELLDLSGRTIANVDFTGARFHAPVVAKGAIFAGLAWFRSARFDASVDVSRAVFNNDLRMKGAQFGGAATFSGAEMRGVCDLDEVCFKDRAELDHLIVMGNVSMAATRFEGPVTLQDSDFMGGLWLESASFGSRADFRGVEVHGRTWLKGTVVGGSNPQAPRDPLREIQSYGYRWV